MQAASSTQLSPTQVCQHAFQVFIPSTGISGRMQPLIGIYFFTKIPLIGIYFFTQQKNSTGSYISTQVQQAHTISTSRFWFSLQASAQCSLQAAQHSHTRQLHRFSSMYTPAIIKNFQNPSSIDTQRIYTIQQIYISQHIYILQSISQSSILYLSIK